MQIGVPKERKTDETRVALRPDQVSKLVSSGHYVYIEYDAGKHAGFNNDAYAKAGARIVEAAQVYEKGRLILKVKCPIESEYHLYNESHILFTFLHFDENIKAQNIKRIVETGVTAIAYEWVEVNGRFPLLEPMSQISGAVFARKAMSLLMEHKGLLGGRYLAHWPAACAMIIGGGNIGINAANVLVRNQFRIVMVDKNPGTLAQRFGGVMPAEMTILQFDEGCPDTCIAEMRALIPSIDIVIMAAVRRPGLPKARCEYILSRRDIALLPENSIVCDATACDRDMVETCVSSDSLTHTYIEEGAIHYNCDHIPALVPGTATGVLTDATFPYVEQLADGFESAVENPVIAKAVMCHRGWYTHECSAAKKHLAYTPLEGVITHWRMQPGTEIRRTKCATS